MLCRKKLPRLPSQLMKQYVRTTFRKEQFEKIYPLKDIHNILEEC